MKVSEHFDLGLSQGELDFVDVDPARDLRLFVDPYAIQINSTDGNEQYHEHLISFFSALLDALRAGDEDRAARLVQHLSEPQETFLGMSAGRPRGRGVGRLQSAAIVQAIRSSEAFQTGQLEDLSEAELFVPGVGPDKISDLSTNVLRKPLIEYTQNVCTALNIPTRSVAAAPAWNIEEERWESRYEDIPVIGGAPVILVPKALIRRRLCLDSQEYYNYYIDFLQAELEVSVGLASALRGRSGRVTKKNVKERYPFDKESLARFAREHPRQFESFKQIARSSEPISDNDIDPEFSYGDIAASLAARIRGLPPGTAHSGDYEKLVMSAVTLLFWPKLTFPIAQRPQHGGRRKLDVEYANYAKGGFWHQMRHDDFIRARAIPVECKNYSNEMGNGPFEQLVGRFGPERGRIGLLFYRSAANAALVRERCRMAVVDRQGYLITISDLELLELLGAGIVERDARVEAFMDGKFRDLINFN